MKGFIRREIRGKEGVKAQDYADCYKDACEIKREGQEENRMRVV